MDRAIEEIVLSQEKMILSDFPFRPLPPRAARTQALREHRESVLSAFRRFASTSNSELSLVEIHYRDCLTHPETVVRQLTDFIGEQLPRPDQMVQAIDPQLHRARVEASREHVH